MTAFEDIEVNLSPAETKQLINSYVQQLMLPESVDMFERTLESSDDLKEALYAAVFNDSAVRMLMQEIQVIEDNDASKK